MTRTYEELKVAVASIPPGGKFVVSRREHHDIDVQHMQDGTVGYACGEGALFDGRLLVTVDEVPSS